jgi:Restriction endonuclease
VKRIETKAYEALREALSAITWNKVPFERYLRTALRERPELLSPLVFSDTKRNVVDALVGRLVEQEAEYQDVTLGLMLEVASMDEFPNIEQMKDEPDRRLRLDDARKKVARLRTLTEPYAAAASSREKAAAAQEARRAEVEALREFADEINELKQRFMQMHSETDPHARGKRFELLLTDLFVIYDMEPRLAYDLAHEQIDGSLSFDTDDYIVEARWRKNPTSRGDADIFAAKVKRKGKNALGLFVSVNGFSQDALDQYQEATPFLAMTGEDVFHVLEDRVRLDDLLRLKKRHANDTGACYLPASSI